MEEVEEEQQEQPYHARATSDSGIEILDAQNLVCATLTSCTPEILARILGVDLTEAQRMMREWDGQQPE